MKKASDKTLRLRRILIITIVSIIGIGQIALGLIYTWRLGFPPITTIASVGVDPADFGVPDYEDVSFETQDGVTLSGWLVPPQGEGHGAGVVISHHHGQNRLLMLTRAAFLSEAGYSVLIYDHRHHGDSEASMSALGWSERYDVIAAYDRLSEEVDQVGVLGVSLGASASLYAAAEDERIPVIIAEGASVATLQDEWPPCSFTEYLYFPTWLIYYPSTWTLLGSRPEWSLTETLDVIAPRPILLIHAGLNDFEMCKGDTMMEGAGEHVSRWVVESDHASGIVADPEGYKAQVLDFLQEHLLED